MLSESLKGSAKQLSVVVKLSYTQLAPSQNRFFMNGFALLCYGKHQHEYVLKGYLCYKTKASQNVSSEA